MVKRINLILFILFLFLPLLGQACFNPTDYFAVEVVLNKYSLSYDLTQLKQEGEAERFIQESEIVYRSHFNPELAVILSETKEGEPLIKCLSVKIQMPTKRIETADGFDLRPAVKIDPDKFNWKSALKTELIWLAENKIISGLTSDDLDSIVQVAARGKAGHNYKIIWGKSPTTGEFSWLPYDKTDNPLLLKAVDCGGFLLSMLPKKQLDLMPEVATTKPNKIYFWLAIVIQLIIFIILVIYSFFLIRKFIKKS